MNEAAAGSPVWRWAVVGCGGMGAHHVKVLRQLDNVEIVAGCDANPATLSNLPPGAEPFTDWRQLLDRSEFDAASVILPNQLYPDVIDALLAKGVHVLKEKPMARDLREAVAMGQAAERAGRHLVVGGQHKFSPAFSATRARMPELGGIFLVRASMLYRVARIVDGAWGWRGEKAISGGVALLDAGWHILELVTLLRGLPRRVTAVGSGMRVSAGQFDVDEQVAAIFEYDDGGIATIETSFVTAPSDIRIIAYGRQASLEFNVAEGWARRHEAGQAESLAPADGEDRFVSMYREFLTVLASGGRMLGDWRAALDVQRVIEAGYLSMARHGAAVRLEELDSPAPAPS